MCDFPWVFSCGAVKKVWHCLSKVRISISIWCEHTLSKSPVLLIALFSWVATVLLWVFMPPLLRFVLAIEDYSVSTLHAEVTQIWLVLPQSDRAWASAFEGCFTWESWFYDPYWDNEIEIFLFFFWGFFSCLSPPTALSGLMCHQMLVTQQRLRLILVLSAYLYSKLSWMCTVTQWWHGG